jgi:hypothetical protein
MRMPEELLTSITRSPGAKRIGLNDHQRAAGHRAHDDLEAGVTRKRFRQTLRDIGGTGAGERAGDVPAVAATDRAGARNALTPALSIDDKPDRSDSLLIVMPRTLTTVAASISPAR